MKINVPTEAFPNDLFQRGVDNTGAIASMFFQKKKKAMDMDYRPDVEGVITVSTAPYPFSTVVSALSTVYTTKPIR